MANKPEEAPIGTGLAKQAVDTIKLRRKYNEEALEAAVSGNPHPDFDEWKQARQGKTPK